MEIKARYGQEIGPNLIKLTKKLIQNQNLLMLLENTDLDPLNKEKHPEHLDGLTFLGIGGLIRFVPLLTPEEQSTKSKLVILIDEGTVSSVNYDNESLSFLIYVYCPFNEWQIAGDQLRPFAIMSEIRQSLQDKRINGLGEIRYLGFSLSTLTDEMGCYAMRFEINAFS